MKHKIPSALNFRGFPDLKTKDGRTIKPKFFRTGDWSQVKADEIEFILKELNIKKYYDFRAKEEINAWGLAAPVENGQIEHRHFPIMGNLFRFNDDGTQIITESYFECYTHILKDSHVALTEIIDHLAHTEDPIVVGCMAGKDRTGVVVAAVLAALNVSDEDIAKNYAITSENLKSRADYFSHYWDSGVVTKRQVELLLHAPENVMIQFLEQVNSKFGSLLNYIRDLGINDSLIQKLRKSLLTNDKK